VNKEKVIVSVVSYINSTPFVYGLEKEKIDNIVLLKDIPSECARKLIDNKIDIGLIPVAMIDKVPNANIISNYCIAGDGAVASVLLASNDPIEEINTVYQDSQSRTSVALAKILMRDYWKKNVAWKDETDSFLFPQKNEAIVIIGDRALKNQNKYNYVFDLSYFWKKHTGLPFVFACWVANKKISDDVIGNLNLAFENGIAAISRFSNGIDTEGLITSQDYLTNYIKYHLTDDSKKGMNLFLDLIKSL